MAPIEVVFTSSEPKPMRGGIKSTGGGGGVCGGGDLSPTDVQYLTTYCTKKPYQHWQMDVLAQLPGGSLLSEPYKLRTLQTHVLQRVECAHKAHCWVQVGSWTGLPCPPLESLEDPAFLYQVKVASLTFPVHQIWKQHAAACYTTSPQ